MVHAGKGTATVRCATRRLKAKCCRRGKGSRRQDGRAACELEGELSSDTLEKGLMSNIQKELTQLNIERKQANIQLEKWAEDLDRHLPKEDTQTANRHTKRRSASPVIRGAQVETAMRCHRAPLRMAVRGGMWARMWGQGSRHARLVGS